MHRKVVTVLFCDVVGSTALGESIDPETLQAVLARYFERMKLIVESHGGTVEKFIGDAVMAVFGVPAAHEDDALRATRAALEMRTAFPGLGIQGRIGVNTGEVVTGTEERLATGDAVNVAARLQQAAAPDEVLIGQPTLDLVRGAVEVETLEPLVLKGKTEPVPAFRVLSIARAPERSHGSRFVGRDRELGEIRQAWAQARAGETCELVTVVGDAGVGKSRLIAEALVGIDARVVRGRCLPYGEGITYWPVIEVLKDLQAAPADPAADAAIRSLLGESDRQTTADEIAWAFRKLLEQEAPLVVIFDDIHWGEETFLDLVEGTSLFSAGGPILIIALARRDLLERRPRWQASLRLEPLEPEAVADLIGDQVAPDLRERIAHASGGNPLFLTEMLAMTGEADQVEVPPTLRALLAARLDQLDDPEREVLERGAVEGEAFHRGAVVAMSPEGEQVTPRLAGLVRKELIRAERAQIAGEDGFRFRHLLIRDAAYDALPKSVRADLHERFGGWLALRGSDLVELDEIVGYHLERAATYRRELGAPDPGLADRAATRLAGAAQRARWLGDEPAAATLFERALVLTRSHRLDVPLELDLADAFWRFDSRRAASIAAAAADRAQAAGDELGEAAARVVAARHRLKAREGSLAELESLATAALPLLEAAGDHTGLAHVWRGMAVVNGNSGRYADARAATEQATEEARLAGLPSVPSSSTGLPGTLNHGPVPADEALEILDRVLPPFPHPRTQLFRASLLGMLQRFDEAWALALEATARLRDRVGDDGLWALADIAMLQGDHETAAGHLRRYNEYLEAHNGRSLLSTSAPRLARELCILGRPDEAEPLAELGRKTGDERDLATQSLWRQARALVESARGTHAEAERLALEAVAIGERTDMLNMLGAALVDLAKVLRAAGRLDDARAAATRSLETYERKKNLAMAAQVRAQFPELSLA